MSITGFTTTTALSMPEGCFLNTGVRLSNMVDIPDNLRAVFTGTVEHQDDAYVVEIPADEVSRGSISPESVYRIALLSTPDSDGSIDSPPEEIESEPTPPVSEGEQRTVTVEAVGSEGDGIAKVERGYVVIVPDSEPGEEVAVEIERVTPSVAFAGIADEQEDTESVNNETSSEDMPSA
jgi:predicted RNA-binding protein with TRAM domain